MASWNIRAFLDQMERVGKMMLSNGYTPEGTEDPEELDRFIGALHGVTGRTCGDCQMCCTTFPIHALEKPAFTRCPNQCEAGCSIYNNRPVECRQFVCMWLNGIFDERDRPDRLGVLFDIMTEPRAIVHQWFEPPNFNPMFAFRCEAEDHSAFYRGRAQRIIGDVSDDVPVLLQSPQRFETSLVFRRQKAEMRTINLGDEWWVYCSSEMEGLVRDSIKAGSILKDKANYRRLHGHEK